MSDIAIRAENLGKEYRIGTASNAGGRQRYKSLRDTIAAVSSAPLRAITNGRRTNGTTRKEHTFWALLDISFEIKHGEVVGILGRNGAGKSTLLKILSRITEPTTGRAQIYGRVASLLEVGTGFHPELTGRENIYMNGAILGMSSTEIRNKFDEIVAFAEVEKFLDTSVKHYSSGMYVRLAFAVAAHLDPDILVVDEVLAVGDIQFQKKCLRRMEQVADNGRTVLLVSHSTTSLGALCKRGLVLSDGRLDYAGEIHSAIRHYTSNRVLAQATDLRTHMHQRRGSGELRLTSFRTLDSNGNIEHSFISGDRIRFELSVEGTLPVEHLLIAVLIRTENGTPVLHLNNMPHRDRFGLARFRVVCDVPECPLYPGRYIISVWIGRNAYQEVDWAPDIQSLTLDQNVQLSAGFDLSWRHGLCHCATKWSVLSISDKEKQL